MDTIGRSELRQLGQEVEEAVKAIAERHGIKVKMDGGTFAGEWGRLKVLFSLTEGDSPEASHFKRMTETGAIRSDDGAVLKPADLGKHFRHGNSVFKIVGWAPRGRTKPIIASRGGRDYSFSVDYVTRARAAYKAERRALRETRAAGSA